MRWRLDESVFVAMHSESPGARNIPAIVLSDEIRTVLDDAGIDCSKINTLRWSFVGASHPSVGCVLLDMSDAESAAVMNGLNPISFHLAKDYAVQLWPIRVETVRYAQSPESGVPSGLRVLHLTDARGIVGMGAAFAPALLGQPYRDQPRVVNQTLDMPLHFAGVESWQEQDSTDAALGETVTVRYQAANSVTKIGTLPSLIGLASRSTGGYGTFADGRTAFSFPILGANMAPLQTGSEDPRALNAPIDFPTGAGQELQAIDAALSLRGWAMAYIPSWSSNTCSIGSFPINPSRNGSASQYLSRCSDFMSFEFFSDGAWSDFALSGSFASMPYGAIVGQSNIGTRQAIVTQAQALSPATAFIQAVTDGSVADIFDGMPDYVIPTLQRGEVMVRTISASPQSIFDWEILPAARTSGMQLNALGAAYPRRYWQYSAIPPNATPEKAPDQTLPTDKILRLNITDYAIVDPSGNNADTPINSGASGAIASAIESYFGQGAVETNARRAAQDFYGRFLIPCGECTMHGLLVFDAAAWWPGLQYAEWSFANAKMPTTKVWGDFWHPAFGFVATRQNDAGRWRLDPDRPVTGSGASGVESIAGCPRVRTDLVTGHVQSFVAFVVASKAIRFDTATGLPVAWLYRVRISHPTTAQYGAAKTANTYQPESSATLTADKNYSDLWVPNLKEVSNTGGNSQHGSGTRVRYSPGTTEPKIVSDPVRNGIPVTLLAFETQAGGTVYAIDCEGPYTVTCATPAASLTDASGSIDGAAYFTAGAIVFSPQSSGQLVGGADACDCGGTCGGCS